MNLMYRIPNISYNFALSYIKSHYPNVKSLYNSFTKTYKFVSNNNIVGELDTITRSLIFHD